MSDPLTGVSVFVQAVESGSFAMAATRLGLSRSAVGKTIARLEQRLGVQLFHRTTRSMSLTDDGQALYEHAARALEALRSAEAMLETGRREVAGRLRVSMPVLFGRRCVAPILSRLTRLHPGLELDLHFSDRPVDLTGDGFDLAIRNEPFAEISGLLTRRLARQRMTVCAAPAYLEAHGTPRTIADLGDHATIAYGRGERIRSWLFPRDADAPEEFIPLGRMRFDDLEAIADAATAGFGLAWLPCWLVRDRVASGELVRLLPDRPGLEFQINAVWPGPARLPLRVRVAIDVLAAELPATTAK
ncbi:MAG: LysR family transcriptional regulator [Rhodospirillales bacterium SCN 65-16]|nr:MAG: LysR family transcriptional regulator [Rhodospirillales bacterium SCN 65-16]